MGLAESTPSSPHAVTPSSSFFHSHRSGRKAPELSRSPSAPARVSDLLASRLNAAPHCVSKPPLKMKTKQALNDDTARVSVLVDGSCAFYKGRRLSHGSTLPPDCHYTCVSHCRNDEATVTEAVQLQKIQDPTLDPLLGDVTIEEEADSMLHVSQIELQPFINEYNTITPPGMDMTLEEDGSTFRGFIRVHMNLCRPISVVAGTRPPSIYDILNDDDTLEKTLTSFYLPRDTIKALHITSETTTHEVIAALLKKFKVVDNPRKFALYERYYEEGETAKVKMRRIAESETPLVLALRWSRETNCNKMFVLQENETGDILWEAFTLPELNNFLRILDREEEEYKKVVRQKYQVLGRKIQEAMERLNPNPQLDTEVVQQPRASDASHHSHGLEQL